MVGDQNVGDSPHGFGVFKSKCPDSGSNSGAAFWGSGWVRGSKCRVFGFRVLDNITSYHGNYGW